MVNGELDEELHMSIFEILCSMYNQRTPCNLPILHAFTPYGIPKVLNDGTSQFDLSDSKSLFDV